MRKRASRREWRSHTSTCGSESAMRVQSDLGLLARHGGCQRSDQPVINHTFKKHCLPWATRMFASPPFRRVPLLLEMTGAALQSKRGAGYAATWQEIAGALNFITRPSPIVFDVGAN